MIYTFQQVGGEIFMDGQETLLLQSRLSGGSRLLGGEVSLNRRQGEGRYRASLTFHAPKAGSNGLLRASLYISAVVVRFD